MNFSIADLSFHPVLVAWMRERFGDCCTGSVLLMLLSITKLGGRGYLEPEVHHMKIVHQSVEVAKTYRRPQRVPTLAEFIALLDAYWSDDDIRQMHYEGRSLISEDTEHRLVGVIRAHEMQPHLERIGVPPAG